MASVLLTDVFLRKKLKPPKAGQVDYFDKGLDGRLVLRVNYGGRMTWRVLHYVKGFHKKTGKARTEPRTFPLGAYPAMTLKQARDKARAFTANPDKALAQAEVGSFREVAENWLKREVDGNGLLSASEMKRHLTFYVYPKWQHRPFLEIRRREVRSLLEYIADHHGKSQADAVLGTLRGLMTWYQAGDDDYTSPIVKGLRQDKRKPKDRKRSRILSDDEIRTLWAACERMPIYGPMLQIMLLTAQRREKVSTMKWDDLKNGVWHIREEEREKGTAGELKLPPLALDIITAQPRVSDNPHVFPGSERGRRHGNTSGPPAFNSFSQRKHELDNLLPKGMPLWVLHDLRRTARSLLSRAGVLSEHAEHVLGHAIVGVKGVYDRHAYFEEKGAALNALAKLVGQILNPPAGKNVVPLPARR